MSPQEHYRKLERSYQRARCNRYYEPALKVAQGTSQVTIRVREEYFHSGGAVHGSVYFKALDDAAYFAVNSLVEDVAVLTVSFTIHFLRPISDGALTASGRLVHASERLFFAESVLTDAANRIIASGMGTFARSKVPLSAGIGYE
jgi:uncharacterized protein (TIGR00369 family)